MLSSRPAQYILIRIFNLFKQLESALEEKEPTDPPERFPLPIRWEVKQSPIHGKGVFATERLIPGARVGLCIKSLSLFGLLGGKRTQIGFFCNHKKDANCEIKREYWETGGRGFGLYTTRDVPEGDELTLDYDSGPWFMASAKAIRRTGTKMID